MELKIKYISQDEKIFKYLIIIASYKTQMWYNNEFCEIHLYCWILKLIQTLIMNWFKL